MVVEMTFGTITVEEVDAPAFISEITASEIVTAYKSGKNVVFHFQPDLTINSTEAAVSMIGYYAEFDTGNPGEMHSPIEISEIVTLGENVQVEYIGVLNGYFCVIAVTQEPYIEK